MWHPVGVTSPYAPSSPAAGTAHAPARPPAAKAADTTRDNPWPLRRLTENIKVYVDRMSPLWVEGQVVEYKVRPGAKMHFLTLRDLETDTSMTVTAWAGVMDSTPLTEGARVVTRVKPVFWERSGRLNLQAAEIHLQGVGDLLAQIEALRARLAAQETKSHMSLDDLFSRIEDGKTTDLNLIVKADVQGSIEALRDAFDKMDQSEVRINIVHSAVGGITETDVTLAAASDAIIIGFNVRPTGKSRQQAEKEKVDIRLYRVIYQAIEDINAARVGLLSPDIVEEDTGIAEVRETFKVPKVGTIAGCYVVEGEIHRDDKVRIVRDGTVIFEGHMASLRRFKDDVKSVKQGYECGIGIEKFQDLKVGDTIEGYQVKEVERTE